VDRVEREVFRQVALYAGVGKEEITGDTLLREELGFDSLTILMLLITLAESLGRNIFALPFELERLRCVDDLVTVFPVSFPRAFKDESLSPRCFH